MFHIEVIVRGEKPRLENYSATISCQRKSLRWDDKSDGLGGEEISTVYSYRTNTLVESQEITKWIEEQICSPLSRFRINGKPGEEFLLNYAIKLDAEIGKIIFKLKNKRKRQPNKMERFVRLELENARRLTAK